MNEKLFMFFSALSLITSCSPEALSDSKSDPFDGPQATNDRDIIVDDGSKQ